VESHTPVPYQLCACSICRKCGGYSGSVNLGGINSSLKIKKGKDVIKYHTHPRFFPTSEILWPLFYQTVNFREKHKETNLGNREYIAIKDRGTPRAQKCTSQRSFCSNCSSMLWLWDHHWPELIHPFASAIDTELPVPEEMVCVRGDSKPKWMRWPEGKKSVHEGFNGETSIEGWHKEKGVYVE